MSLRRVRDTVGRPGYMLPAVCSLKMKWAVSFFPFLVVSMGLDRVRCLMKSLCQSVSGRFVFCCGIRRLTHLSERREERQGDNFSTSQQPGFSAAFAVPRLDNTIVLCSGHLPLLTPVPVSRTDLHWVNSHVLTEAFNPNRKYLTENIKILFKGTRL